MPAVPGLLPPHHGAHPLHDVLHQLALHVVTDPGHRLLLQLDVEQLHPQLDGGALHKDGREDPHHHHHRLHRPYNHHHRHYHYDLQEDGEEDHGEGGGDEELAVPEVLLQHHGQGEPDSAAEAAVRHDELGLGVDPLLPLDVHQVGEEEGADEPDKLEEVDDDIQDNMNKPDDEAEDDCGEDETCVEVMVLLDELEAEEEEDDTVAGGGEGLDAVLDGGVALLADVLEAVPLDSDAVGDDADDTGPEE